MTSVKQNNYKKTNSQITTMNSPQVKTSGKLYLLPIIFILAVLPFIMYLYKFNTGLAQFTWGFATDTGVDIFLHYKMISFIIATSILVIITIYQAIAKKINIHITYPLIILFAYGLLSFLSTITSKYSHWGYTGINDQFESVFALIGYCIVVFYIWIFIRKEEDVKFIFKCFIISILVLSLLGFTQFIGQDFLRTTIGKKLYIPPMYWANLDDLEFNFEANRVYLTFFNPNYVGVYVSMVLPILIGLLFTEKVKKHIIMISIAIVGMLICLLGSLSSTGVISVGFTFILLIIFFRKYIFKSKRVVFISLATILLLTVPIAIFKSNSIKNTFQKLLTINQTEFAVSKIVTAEQLSITYNKNVMKLDLDVIDNTLDIKMTDENGDTLEAQLTDDMNGYIITDERFKNITVTPIYSDVLCLQITMDKKEWIFSNQLGDGTFYYLNGYDKFDKIVNPETVLFTGYEKYASSRGYIWSRSIPLLKNYLLLGAGADAYTFVFPQQDYVGFYNAGLQDGLLTKPHSMYLQIGIQTGVLSLLCVLAFYGIYFVTSIRRYFNGNFDTYYKRIGVSIYLGTIGYMIAGITNDSSITIAPVFWVLLGLGYTINHLVKVESMNKEESK